MNLQLVNFMYLKLPPQSLSCIIFVFKQAVCLLMFKIDINQKSKIFHSNNHSTLLILPQKYSQILIGKAKFINSQMNQFFIQMMNDKCSLCVRFMWKSLFHLYCLLSCHPSIQTYNEQSKNTRKFLYFLFICMKIFFFCLTSVISLVFFSMAVLFLSQRYISVCWQIEKDTHILLH